MGPPGDCWHAVCLIGNQIANMSDGRRSGGIMGIRALVCQSIVLQRSSNAEPVDCFSETRGTPFFGLTSSWEKVVRTLSQISEKGSDRGVARSRGHDKGTICKWVDLAGKHVVTKRPTMDCYYALLSSLALPTLKSIYYEDKLGRIYEYQIWAFKCKL
jgi:hypothetical protein